MGTKPSTAKEAPPPSKPIRKLMVANRSEIAIRVFRSAHELGIRTVAIYAHEDRFALHRFKADEAYRVGKPGEPLRSYLDIENIIALARDLARKLGYPVIVKAAMGGGGRGMRVAHAPDKLDEALEQARREAGTAF